LNNDDLVGDTRLELMTSSV